MGYLSFEFVLLQETRAEMDKSCVRRTVTINLGDYLLEGEYMVPTYTEFNLDRCLNISHISS